MSFDYGTYAARRAHVVRILYDERNNRFRSIDRILVSIYWRTEPFRRTVHVIRACTTCARVTRFDILVRDSPF